MATHRRRVGATVERSATPGRVMATPHRFIHKRRKARGVGKRCRTPDCNRPALWVAYMIVCGYRVPVTFCDPCAVERMGVEHV